MKKEIKIIKCDKLDLMAKDMIEISSKNDFIYLLGDGCIFKFQEYYYIISSEVVYYIKEWRI